MNEMIARVATAVLAVLAAADPARKPADSLLRESIGRAAIQAMREPTVPMVARGITAFTPGFVTPTYQAMIDGALE